MATSPSIERHIKRLDVLPIPNIVIIWLAGLLAGIPYTRGHGCKKYVHIYLFLRFAARLFAASRLAARLDLSLFALSSKHLKYQAELDCIFIARDVIISGKIRFLLVSFP